MCVNKRFYAYGLKTNYDTTQSLSQHRHSQCDDFPLNVADTTWNYCAVLGTANHTTMLVDDIGLHSNSLSTIIAIKTTVTQSSADQARF